MNEFEIIPALSFEQYEDEGDFEQERGRIGGGAHARAPVRRAAAPRGRAGPPFARARPSTQPPRPRPRARPRPLAQPPRSRPRPGPLPWPPYGVSYTMPVVVERGDGAAPAQWAAAGGSDDERWRCVQACFNRAAGGAPEGSAAAPAPGAAAPDGSAPDGAAAAPDGNGAAGPASEGDGGEFEYEGEYEGEFETSPGLMTLAAAIADPRAASPGVYTLFKDGQRVYVGRARQLRRRLQQHLLCLTHLKLAVGRFRVKLTPLPAASPAHLSRVEAAVIGRFGRAAQGGALANVRSREF